MKETPKWPADLAGDEWRRVDGDFTHRLNHDLNENSIVFDIGGFKGKWTNNIFTRYKSFVYVFEPVKEYYEFMEKLFEGNEKIKIFNCGFSDSYKKVDIVLNNDASSIYTKSNVGVTERITLFNFREYISKFSKIDLVELNIEGEEYVLLDSLDSKHLKRIKNLQVQFHQNVENYVEKRQKIREKLSLTHELTYDYEFVWENWKLKE